MVLSVIWSLSRARFEFCPLLPSPALCAPSPGGRGLIFQTLAFGTKSGSVGIERSERPDEIVRGRTEMEEPIRQRLRVGIFLWAEATVTASVVRGTQDAASGVRNRSHTWNASGNHDANYAFAFAVQADAVRRYCRRPIMNKGIDDVDELIFIDRTSPQLKIHLHMGGDGRGCFERRYVFRPGIH